MNMEDAMLSVVGRVVLDGGIVYINGMELAGLIRAFQPPDTGENHYNRGLRITVEEVEPVPS